MRKRINSLYKFSQIRGVQNLKRLGWILGEKPEYLIELAIQKNNYYKPFTVKKPGKKDRPIDQPTGELLRVQTRIRDRILDLAPLCKATYGAVVGKNTKMNASNHLRKDCLVKLDLRDCFHSSKSRMVRRLFKNRFGYSKPVADLLTELCTFEGHVPVGSTLSSTLVNLILNPVWEKIDKYCTIHDLAITTWVDDIAISGKAADKVISEIKRLIHSYGFRISWNKLEVLRKSRAQTVTGCGVNNSKITLPKSKRRQIAKTIIDNPSSPKAVGQLTYAISLNKSQSKQLTKLKQRINAS